MNDHPLSAAINHNCYRHTPGGGGHVDIFHAEHARETLRLGFVNFLYVDFIVDQPKFIYIATLGSLSPPLHHRRCTVYNVLYVVHQHPITIHPLIKQNQLSFHFL